ncbi:carbohydrate kinase family protein [Nocardia sp. 2]|uniref:Carbohydrate kinase family protein n=1 Tax=Nocardia acididurans TaxID=2802282 RepID=A0ABS1M8R7_9NOCA|nr:carbohydrate kinase family protein [Nocardia acididurans]MBL1076946.1 carbohydrate kinase family protein [Nocardia acididurans]
MVAVRSILIRLRKRSGLSPDRLQSTEIDTRTLLELSSVRRHAHVSQTTPEQALPELIGKIARTLPVTQRLIVDVELCLELLREHPPAGVDLDQLYAADLGDRRRSLARQWRRLHTTLGAARIPSTPTARSLRDSPETGAFTALAELLASGYEPDGAQWNTVTVVGDAVFDQIHRVEQIPEVGMSEWGRISRHPGGKGLNRAVALARLGLDARLLAAIGDDDDGREIREYLCEHRVDISLVKVRRNARTPVTTVLMPRAGGYASIADKEGRTALTAADLNSAPYRQAIAGANVVLLTFEQSPEVVEQVLNVVATLKRSRGHSTGPPWLIVNVSPPRSLRQSTLAHLAAIDFLVGSPRELDGLWPGEPTATVIKWLLDHRVGTVCVIDGFQCRIHRAGAEPAVVPVAADLSSFAGAASAFSSALTYRLVTGGGAVASDDFLFAVVMAEAVASDQPVESVPDLMPSMTAVDTTAFQKPPEHLNFQRAENDAP